MSSQHFSLYLRNLLEADLLHPETLLILFGGEFLNHPECLEICRIAAEKKMSTMNLVIITSGKFLDEFKNQVEELGDQKGLFHHWEVSIKDFESFQFGMNLLEKGETALFRYDYLDSTSLKKCAERFFKHVRLGGIWKEFEKNNRGLQKRLRHIRHDASPDMVIIEEFYYPSGNDQCDSAGLIFSPLDRSVMRGGGKRLEAQCSLFHPQYHTAVHVTRDGMFYPCHLPRFKKGCEPLGNVGDMEFLRCYRQKIEAFKDALKGWQKREYPITGTCIEGCRGKITIEL